LDYLIGSENTLAENGRFVVDGGVSRLLKRLCIIVRFSSNIFMKGLRETLRKIRGRIAGRWVFVLQTLSDF
jgi:hypothetical protein